MWDLSCIKVLCWLHGHWLTLLDAFRRGRLVLTIDWCTVTVIPCFPCLNHSPIVLQKLVSLLTWQFEMIWDFFFMQRWLFQILCLLPFDLRLWVVYGALADEWTWGWWSFKHFQLDWLCFFCVIGFCGLSRVYELWGYQLYFWSILCQWFHSFWAALIWHLWTHKDQLLWSRLRTCPMALPISSAVKEWVQL